MPVPAVDALRPDEVPEDDPSAFRDLLAALSPRGVRRILDVGAGGFVGDVTTRHLLELCPDAVVTALELRPERVDALRERFAGAPVEVVEGDVRELAADEPFDLVVIDLDTSVIPLIFDELLDGVIARVTRPGALVITLVMTDQYQAFFGEKAYPPTDAERHERFMLRRFGALRLTDESLKEQFAGNPRYDALVLVDKWRRDPANFIGWLALRRTDVRALTDDELDGRRRVEPLAELAAFGAVSALDLVGDRSGCGPDCAAHLERWAAWARTAFEGWVDGAEVAFEQAERLARRSPAADVVVAPVVPLALLEPPGDIEAYRSLIWPQARNKLRKALKNGYTYQPFEYNERLEEMHAINTSKPERQGQPMTEGYTRPLTPVQPFGGCERHDVVYLGGFREGRLRAYARLVILNELAVIDQFLGHGDDLRFAVMNGLVDFIVAYAIERGLRAIDYLTLRSVSESLDRFKRSVGFQERVALLALLA